MDGTDSSHTTLHIGSTAKVAGKSKQVISRNVLLCLSAGFIVSVFHIWCSELHIGFIRIPMTQDHSHRSFTEMAVHFLQLGNFPSLAFWFGDTYVGNYYAGLVGFLIGYVAANSLIRLQTISLLRKHVTCFGLLLLLCDVLATGLILLSSDSHRQTAVPNFSTVLIPAATWTFIALVTTWVRTRDPKQEPRFAMCHFVAYLVSLLHLGCFLLFVENTDDLHRHGTESARILRRLDWSEFILHLPVSIVGGMVGMWLYVPILGYVLGYTLARLANKKLFRISRWALAWWFAVIVVAWEAISVTWMVHEFGLQVDVPGWRGLFFFAPLPLTLLCFAYKYVWNHFIAAPPGQCPPEETQ